MIKGIKDRAQGYGRMFTPRYGPMIVHFQRERGLASRTFVLTHRQLKILRASALAFALVFVMGAASWVYLATQASRVPFLTRRVTNLQRDVRRLDTLQTKLTELEARYFQVQRMLGLSHPNTAPVSRDTAHGTPAPAEQR
ncbi:MAG: hypothetical protein M3081_15765 [Gemmatimonadota bacterium]|nr:hypothetical protein [Gemmatimonadota bacterium]